MRLVLSGNPQSTNHVYGMSCIGKHPRRYMTAAGKTAKEAYQYELKSQWKREPLTGDIIINVVMYFSDHRKRDWDNYHKLTMDACNGIVWEDDSQIVEAHVFKEHDADNPRTEIYVLH